jgi:nucleotide-binding universal stress UspA family protein
MTFANTFQTVRPAPVVVAFDGSEPSCAAVRAAAELFGGHRLLVVSVWEPGLAMVTTTRIDAMGLAYPPPSDEEIRTVDRAERDHATSTATAGTQLATDLGAPAEAVPAPDGGDVAETIEAIAARHDAAAIVIGSRGLGRVRSTLLGSTSRRLLRDARRPVLVVRNGD